MSATSEPHPDRPSDQGGPAHPHRRDPSAGRPRRSRRPRQPPRSDLDVLAADPSLASLRWQGWQLDGLPTTSVAWTFVAALATVLLAFGALGAALVISAIVVACLLTASAILMRDVAAARAMLHLTRFGMVGCVLAGAAQL